MVEATSLMLQAMHVGNDGEVVVLDMGSPIKILDLAEQVIRLSGLTPYRDIDIVETAMRPGEKLFEEILTHSEGFNRTSHQRLFIAKQERLDYMWVGRGIDSLRRNVQAGDWRSALDVLRGFVPEYAQGLHLLDEVKPERTAASPDVTVPLATEAESVMPATTRSPRAIRAEITVDRASEDTHELITTSSSVE
jgi:FlaA1/EpsC-like NDP-sugar epimerase